jgi:hypothetical protein
LFGWLPCSTVLVKLWLERDVEDVFDPATPAPGLETIEEEAEERELDDVPVVEVPFVPVDPATIPAPYEVCMQGFQSVAHLR